MNKKSKIIKIIIILFIVLYFSMIVFYPNVRAAPLDSIYECRPFVKIEYNKTLAQKPIIPYDEPRKIPITVNVKIIGAYPDIVADSIGDGMVSLIVDASIESVSEGCYASINPPLLKFNVSDEYESANATLSFTIDRYFPSGSLKNVKINISCRRLGGATTLVKPEKFIKEIPFIVDYIPQLSFSYPEGTVKSVAPKDMVNFPIEIENWGNAVTDVNVEIADIPDGWSANIIKNLTLKTNLFGGDSKETVLLTVKPPINFGYHEDRAIIKVKMTPVEYNKTENVGESSYLYFVIQSTGFSTPGFETITTFLAIILIFLPIILKKKNIERRRKQVLKKVRK